MERNSGAQLHCMLNKDESVHEKYVGTDLRERAPVLMDNLDVIDGTR